MQRRRPYYFPVKAERFRMQPGLFRLGTDFGNGESDRLVFPRDAELPRYLAEKSRVLTAHPERETFAPMSPVEVAALRVAEAELRKVLAREGHPAAAASDLSSIARAVAEDLVIAHAGSGVDRALWVNVCFPSGWRPERIAGSSFVGIHARIPAFEALLRSASSLVEAMVTRGPYVRFVWTVCADDELDHHPEQGYRTSFDPRARRGFLRVERQTTVPVPEARACIFVIRTYLYDFTELSPEDRSALCVALDLMPPDVRAYKALDTAVPHALALLRR